MERVLRHHPATRERTGDRAGQHVEVERLGQILVCANLGRTDGGGQCVLRREDDDREQGKARGNAADMIDTVAVRKNDVGDEDIGERCGERAFELREAVGDRHLMPGTAERLRNDGPDRGVVVDDQNRTHDAALGSSRRRTVISGVPSRAYWTIPPMSRVSLSTSARPSPCPSRRPDTNGSNR